MSGIKVNKAQINLRAGKERVHAEQVHHHAALDAAHDPSFDGLLLFKRVEYAVPDAQEVGAGLGKNDLSFVVLDLFEEHVDFVAGFELLHVFEFRQRNDAFGLEVDVDNHFLCRDAENPAANHLSLFETVKRFIIILQRFFDLIRSIEIFFELA